MSIKKSQAILKCFKDLKYSDWFSLGSEDETNCFVTLFFQLPVKVFKTLNDPQSYILRKFHKSNSNNPAKPIYHMSITKSQAKWIENIGLPVI